MENQRIKEVLENHGVIAFPTETVMGLGVLYDDEEAVNKMNMIKGRPDNKPYTLMLFNKKDISKFALLDDRAKKIIDVFVPGPITIILKIRPGFPEWIDLKTGKIGIRIPSYKPSIKVLKAANKPLLVPSANKSGQMPALNSEEVFEIFGDSIDLVIEGVSGKQTPSTIVDLTGEEIKILREGPLKTEDILKAIGD